MSESCIMNEFKPQNLGILESCQLNSHNSEDVSFENYSVVSSKAINNPDQ